MKNCILILSVLIWFAACKKSEETPGSPLFVDFKVAGNTGVTSLPKSVTFTADIPDIADSVSWDFGDSTTAKGATVNHTYSRYGTYQVTITGKKGSRVGTATRVIPVTIFKKFQINRIDILKTEPYASGGLTWDSGSDKPDLTTEITMPDSLYRSKTVLFDIDTGTINIIPPLGTKILDGAVHIEILDYDSSSVPNKKFMGFVEFNISDYIFPTMSNTATLNLTRYNTSLKVTISWVP